MTFCPRYQIHIEIESDLTVCPSLFPSIELSGHLDCIFL